MVPNFKIALSVGSPDSKLMVVDDGGLVRRATMSEPACLRWSSRETFGIGMTLGNFFTVSTCCTALVLGKKTC